MAISPTYPGVYVREVPSGVRTITGVSTAVAAFVDSFERGPLDTAVRILSFADFEREFGGLQKSSSASYGIQQYFLNGGREAYVVRVGSEEPDFSLATASVIARGTHDGGSQIFRVFAGTEIQGISRPNPGVWGNNLRLEVDYDTGDPAELFAGEEAASIVPGELFNLTISRTMVENGVRHVIESETFRNLTMRPGATRNALELVNSSSALIQLDREDLNPPDPLAEFPGPSTVPSLDFFRPAATGTTGGAAGSTMSVSGGETFEIVISVGGSDSNWTCTLPNPPIPPGETAPVDLPSSQVRRFVQTAIRTAEPSASSSTESIPPTLAGASVELLGDGSVASPFRFRVLAGRGGTNFDSSTILRVRDTGGTFAGDLGLTEAEGAVENVQLYSLGFPVPDPVVPNNAIGFQQADIASDRGVGADGVPAQPENLIGSAESKIGMHALRDVDLVNILCIPRAAAPEFTETDAQAVYSEAISLCNDERAFLLIDVPDNVDSVDAMETWLTDNATLRDKNAAVYFPRVRVPDPLDDFRLKNFAPSGTIAGLMARTDSSRGVWKAPAGMQANLRGVSSLQVLMTDAENGVLNPQAVNALRVFPNGIVSWGARTLVGFNNSGQGDHRYIPVRRFQLFLEESLYRGLRFAVFEPNDEPLWAQIRLAAGAFMNNLFRKGAFQGQKSSDAYFVKCDSETTTQNDINLGIVNVLVGFAPLKPAEFVIIRIQQRAGEVQT